MSELQTTIEQAWEKRADLKHLKLAGPAAYLRRFWYDTSVYNLDMLEFLVRKVGASQIIMGSDYPSGEDDPVGFVRRARGLSAADEEAILSGNGARLLGLSI